MRAKQQPTTQLTQSSLALTILPSAANGRSRKSRAADAPAAAVAPPAPPAPAPVPEAMPAPMEFAAAPSAAPAASPPTWAPPPDPAWSPPSDSRFGNVSAPQYQVNYPAAPGFPPQPAYTASAGVDYLPPSAPVQGPGQTPPGHWVPQHAGYPSGPTPKGSKTRIRVIIAVCVVLVLAIAYALTKPTFYTRHKTAARDVVLPAALVDQQRLDSGDFAGDTAAQVANLQQAISGVTEAQAAYYGQDGEPVFMVVAGKLPVQPTSADEKAFFSATARINKMTLTPVGSGPFGGGMQCGQQTIDGTNITTCASLDSAAVVVLLAANTSPSDLALVARQVIGSVEQKS